MSRLRKNTDTESVQSVNRALTLLEIVAKENNISISKIAEQSGLKISTAHRLISTLLQRGYIDQDPVTLQYRLGLKTFEVGNASLVSSDLRTTLQPLLRDLRDRVNETVNLAVLDGTEVVYIDQHESSNTVIVRMFAKMGSRGPAYCTSTGKALLAELPIEEVRHRFAGVEFVKFTENTIVNIEHLIEELIKIKANGYALDLSERDLGVTCVAAGIRNYTGSVQAAISVSGPENRMSIERLKEEILPQLKVTVEEASHKLGYINNNVTTFKR